MNKNEELEFKGIGLLAGFFIISFVAGIIVFINQNIFLGKLLLGTACFVFILLISSSFFSHTKKIIYGIASIAYPLILLIILKNMYSIEADMVKELDEEAILFMIAGEITLLRVTYHYWFKQDSGKF